MDARLRDQKRGGRTHLKFKQYTFKWEKDVWKPILSQQI